MTIRFNLITTINASILAFCMAKNYHVYEIQKSHVGVMSIYAGEGTPVKCVWCFYRTKTSTSWEIELVIWKFDIYR